MCELIINTAEMEYGMFGRLILDVMFMCHHIHGFNIPQKLKYKLHQIPKLNVSYIVLQLSLPNPFNTLRPRQNGRHFADDTFNRIFVNENDKFLLKFVPKGINNIQALVQIMAWRRPGKQWCNDAMKQW